MQIISTSIGSTKLATDLVAVLAPGPRSFPSAWLYPRHPDQRNLFASSKRREPFEDIDGSPICGIRKVCDLFQDQPALFRHGAAAGNLGPRKGERGNICGGKGESPTAAREFKVSS